MTNKPNTHEFKSKLKGKDKELFEALDLAGWNIELDNFQFILRNYDLNTIQARSDTDEEFLSEARKVHKIYCKGEPSSASERHTKLDHEVGLRAKVLQHLSDQEQPPEVDVECASGIADIVTQDAIYEIVCGLNDENIESIARKVGQYCNDINMQADAVIITCCTSDLSKLKEKAFDQQAVHVMTFEEFVASPPKLQVAVPEPSAHTESLFPIEASSAPTQSLLMQQMLPGKLSSHPQLLMRAAGLDPDHVRELEQGYRAGRAYPPADVFFDGDTYWVADGNHRAAGAARAGALVDVHVHEGTLRDAILFALRSNTEHGLRLTNDDKRLKAVTLLSDAEWFKQSDSMLSEKAGGISQPFIGQVRRDLARLLPLLQADPDGEESDEDLATASVSAIGLVQVVRALPAEEREVLTQNVLGDDGRRKGVDGVVRAAPSKAIEPEAQLFQEEPGVQTEMPESEISGAGDSDGATKTTLPAHTVDGDEALPLESKTEAPGEPEKKFTVSDIVNVIKTEGTCSRLKLEEMGFPYALILSGLSEGVIIQPEFGMFSLPSTDDTPARETSPASAPAKPKAPSLEEILKGRALSVSFVWIPGVAGIVNVSVNAGKKPEEATRKAIESKLVPAFPEEILQMIHGQLKAQKIPAKTSSSKKKASTTKKGAGSSAHRSSKKAAKKGASKKSAKKQGARAKA